MPRPAPRQSVRTGAVVQAATTAPLPLPTYTPSRPPSKYNNTAHTAAGSARAKQAYRVIQARPEPSANQQQSG